MCLRVLAILSGSTVIPRYHNKLQCRVAATSLIYWLHWRDKQNSLNRFTLCFSRAAHTRWYNFISFEQYMCESYSTILTVSTNKTTQNKMNKWSIISFICDVGLLWLNKHMGFDDFFSLANKYIEHKFSYARMCPVLLKMEGEIQWKNKIKK